MKVYIYSSNFDVIFSCELMVFRASGSIYIYISGYLLCIMESEIKKKRKEKKKKAIQETKNVVAGELRNFYYAW